jgi:hypothetical protein
LTLLVALECLLGLDELREHQAVLGDNDGAHRQALGRACAGDLLGGSGEQANRLPGLKAVELHGAGPVHLAKELQQDALAIPAEPLPGDRVSRVDADVPFIGEVHGYSSSLDTASSKLVCVIAGLDSVNSDGVQPLAIRFCAMS